MTVLWAAILVDVIVLVGLAYLTYWVDKHGGTRP